MRRTFVSPAPLEIQKPLVKLFIYFTAPRKSYGDSHEVLALHHQPRQLGGCQEEDVWGVSKRHKNTIAKVKPGDRLIFYVKQERKDKQVLEPKIAGIFEVVREPYTDSTRIFKSPPHLNETYPLKEPLDSLSIRVKIKPIKLGELDFKPLIPKLKFITHQEEVERAFNGQAMREIPEEDYKLIAGKVCFKLFKRLT